MPRVSKILNVSPPESFVSIDASTNSMAFAVYESSAIVGYGKIRFYGGNINEKVKDISKKTKAFFEALPYGTIIVIEDTIFTNSHNTAAQLSKAHGALLAAAFLAGTEEAYMVSPMAWQSFIGTRLLNEKEKEAIRKAAPNKSAAWYKAREREIRKNKTIDTMNRKYGFDLDDDDIADAMGLATYAASNWGKVTKEKK